MAVVLYLITILCIDHFTVVSSSFRQGQYSQSHVNRNLGNQNYVHGPGFYLGIKGDTGEDRIHSTFSDDYGEDIIEPDIHFDLTSVYLPKKGTKPPVTTGQQLPIKRQPLHRQTGSSIAITREDYPIMNSHMNSIVLNHVRQNLELRRKFNQDQQKINNIYEELGNLVHSLNEINVKIDKVVSDTNQRLAKMTNDVNKQFERMRTSINLLNTKLGSFQTTVETNQGQLVQEIGGIQTRTKELNQKCDNNYATVMKTLQAISQMTTNPLDRIGHLGSIGETPSDR